MKFRNEDPVEALRQVFQACEWCAIQYLRLQFLDLTTGVMNVFAELLPTIPVNSVHLRQVRNGDGGTMDGLLPLFRGLSKASLLPDPPEQATNATLRVCRERGVPRVFVNAADLLSYSATSDEGIFDFCFGAEAAASSACVRELTLFRPHLTPQFVGRLISKSMNASTKTPLILKIKEVVFETTAFQPVPCDRHPGLCYRFDADVPFHLHVDSTDETLELRRGAAVDDHMVQP